jgi:beta-glucosidase
VHRILRSMFAVGVIDNPPVPKVVDVFQGLEDAQLIAENSIVLLKNAASQLPLRAAAVKSIAVIGGHADVGVLSGGGSAQVDPAGGNPVPPPPGAAGRGMFGGAPVYHRSSPLKAIQAKVPRAKVEFNAGADAAAAAALAKTAEVAIVFATQPMSEGRDAASLSLPDKQDELISAVAKANPHTIVVLETGGPVTMPWINEVSAVLEAWYPGIRGGEAIANVLFGNVNPSAKLPVTFPKSEKDLPFPEIPGSSLLAAARGGAAGAPAPGPGGPGRGSMPAFDIPYHKQQGLKIGYKWFDAENREPLFPFGYGLSYTAFAYSGLKVNVSGKNASVTFTVRNTGKTAGAEVAQVYASLPEAAGEPPKRLVGWEKVPLAPGEAKTVTVNIDPLFLCIFNEQKDGWELPRGQYTFRVGGSSRALPLSQTVTIDAAY